MVSSAEEKVFHGLGVQFIFSLQNFIHFCLFAALMTFYIFRILLLKVHDAKNTTLANIAEGRE